VYEIIGGIKRDQFAQVAGRDATGTWWYIKDPGNPNGFCWVAVEAVTVEGETESIPIVAAPVATVTKLEVRTEPQRMTIACSEFPQVFVFIADITTNGPTVVTWRWEINTGEVSLEQTMIFESAGTKTAQEFYRVVTPNDYWVIARALTPNETSAQAYFFALCSP
jgi:hypothetical protein